VVIATADPTAEAHLAGIPGVDRVEHTGGDVTVTGAGENLMTGVIQRLADHRIHVTDFRTIVPTLEDVFLKLTGHSIRE
jgi:ABC-2 type transport system ATP-binding protein